MLANQLLSFLEAHPQVQVTRAMLNPGASPEVLQKVEADLGCPLAPSLREFYLAHNGFVLEWICKDTPRFDEEAHVRHDDDLPTMVEYMWDKGPLVDGQLVFPPMEEVFVRQIDEDTLFSDLSAAEAHEEYLEDAEGEDDSPYEFDGKTYDNESDFRSRLRYVDFFLPEIGVVLLFEEGNPDPNIYYEAYRGGGFHEGRKMPLSQYLAVVMQNFGLRWRRDMLFTAPDRIATKVDPAERLEEILEFCRRYGQ